MLALDSRIIAKYVEGNQRFEEVGINILPSSSPLSEPEHNIRQSSPTPPSWDPSHLTNLGKSLQMSHADGRRWRMAAY
jgi:hypothetical protein